MSHNFNSNGGPFGPPGGSIPNGFEPFGGNIMYTSQSSPIQQSFPQSWPVTPAWQSFDNQNYGYGLPYQGQNMGTSSSLTSQQQDYVPFDEGEDFYGNEDDTAMGDGHGVNNSGQSEIALVGNITSFDGQKQSTVRKTNAPTPVKPQTKNEQQQSSSNATTGEKLTTDPSEQLAHLRAKLKAQQQRKSATATPTPAKGNNAQTEPVKDAAGDILKEKAGEGTLNGQVGKVVLHQSLQAEAGPKADDKSLNMSPSLASVPSSSQADIESLFSEVKAGMSGQAESGQRLPNGRELTRKSSVAPNGTPSGTKEEIPTSNGQHHPNDDTRSEASEGEIREDDVESAPANKPPEPRSPDGIASAALAADHKRPVDNKSNQPVKTSEVNTAVKQGGRPPESALPPRPLNAVRSSTVAGPASRLHTAAPAPPADGDRRTERPLGSDSRVQDSRLGRGQDSRRRDSAGGSERPTQPSRAYPNGPDRTTIESDHQYGDREPQLSRSTKNPDNASSAVKIRESNFARPNNDADLRTMSQRATAPEETLKAPKTPTNKGAESISVVERKDSTSNIPPHQLTNRIEPSMFANQQMYEDVVDWLEMTDWNDVLYRTQSLARHRKLKALDIQRAELEREAQLELEQRSRSIRSRSTLPVEIGSIQSVFSPQVLNAKSETVMAPPPLPLKGPEDLGLRIKDLANAEVQANSGTAEANRSGKQPNNLQGGTTVPMKRERADDVEPQRLERTHKLPRLDPNDRFQERKALVSPGTKDDSLESRITRNKEPRSAGYKRRSQSPDRRQRPLSPVHRRVSDADGYHSRSRGGETMRGDLYSPRVSRDNSPARRTSGTRALPLYQESQRFERDFGSRIQYDRESQYQSNYRGRGNGRSRSYNYRGSYRSYGNRGGAQGRSTGSESLNLKQGG